MPVVPNSAIQLLKLVHSQVGLSGLGTLKTAESLKQTLASRDAGSLILVCIVAGAEHGRTSHMASGNAFA